MDVSCLNPLPQAAQKPIPGNVIFGCATTPHDSLAVSVGPPGGGRESQVPEWNADRQQMQIRPGSETQPGTQATDSALRLGSGSVLVFSRCHSRHKEFLYTI